MKGLLCSSRKRADFLKIGDENSLKGIKLRSVMTGFVL